MDSDDDDEQKIIRLILGLTVKRSRPDLAAPGSPMIRTLMPDLEHTPRFTTDGEVHVS
jgi:hypothetical protein